MKRYNSNYLSLFSIEILILIIPFVIYPFLIRIFGAEIYGGFVFNQAVIIYILVFIQFGFNLTAVRDLSKNRECLITRNKIFSVVLIIKSVVFLISGFILLCIHLFFYELNYLFLLSPLLLSEVISLQWWYQGHEKLKVYTFFLFTSKLIFLGLVFFLLDNGSSIEEYIVILSLTTLIQNLAIFWYTWLKYQLDFSIDLKQVKASALENLSIFISRFFAITVEKSGTIVLGLFYSNGVIIAQFDLASKLTSLFMLPFSVWNRVYFPIASKEGKPRQVLKNILKMLIVAVFCYCLSPIILPSLIELYTGEEELAYAYNMFMLLAITVLLNIVSQNVGNCILLNHNHTKSFNQSVIISAALYQFLLVCLYYSSFFSVVNFILLLILFPLLVSLGRVWTVVKYKMY